jgi:hypothetical protein
MSEEEIRVLKAASCSSLSGRSTITYEIGCKADKSIHIRLTENTGSGMFSKAWLPIDQIVLLLSAEDMPITSRAIRSLYTGSINSCGFLWAVLKDVGLIKNVEGNSRTYILADPKKFTAEIHALIESPATKKPAKEKKSKTTDPEE